MHKEIKSHHKEEITVHKALINVVDEVYAQMPSIDEDILDLPVSQKLNKVKERVQYPQQQNLSGEAKAHSALRGKGVATTNCCHRGGTKTWTCVHSIFIGGG
jgi:hypothetical protein